MILEVAQLKIRDGLMTEFEAAFGQAQQLLAASPGHLGHELQRCIERESEYVLLVRWETVEAHETGFRQSAAFEQWKRLLHPFYVPFPVVSHYRRVAG